MTEVSALFYSAIPMEKVDADGGGPAASQRISIEHVDADQQSGGNNATPVSWCSFWRRRLLWDYATTLAMYALMLILSTQLQSPVRFIPNLATSTIEDLRKFDAFIAYPLTPDTVPYWAVLILVVVPLPLLAAIIVLTNKQRSLLELHAACMVVFQGCAIQLFFVEVSKVVAGRYRPDYLSRCTAISSAGVCASNDASQAADGHKSFPSGHSSSSFFGVLVTVLVSIVPRSCCIKCRLVSERVDRFPSIRVCFPLQPCWCCLCIAPVRCPMITRVMMAGPRSNRFEYRPFTVQMHPAHSLQES